MNTVQEFTWSDRYLLGHSAMDDTHREFVACVDALLTASDAGIPEALEAFIRHAEAHFKQENDWLAAPDFPGGGECHIEEHDKVIRSAYEVREHIALNNAPRCCPRLRPCPGRLVPRACRLHGLGPRGVARQAHPQRPTPGVPPQGGGVRPPAGRHFAA
jgi:hemerythrin-like metal-binding protein